MKENVVVNNLNVVQKNLVVIGLEKKISKRCVVEHCQLKKVGKCKLQKQCCDKKKRCRWAGPIFSYKCKRICRDVRVGKCHVRSKCCDSNGLKCKFVGKRKSSGFCHLTPKCSFKKISKCFKREYCCRGKKMLLE